MSQIANPYARAVATATAAREKENESPQVNNNNNMGPQSQRRLTLNERTHLLQSQSHNKKKRESGQQTLFGDRAFEPEKDCAVCKARLWGRSVHRSHHKLCTNNRNKRGQTAASIELNKEEKRLKLLFNTPLTEAEKCSAKHLTKEATAAHFEPRKMSAAVLQSTITTTTTAAAAAANVTAGKTRVTANDLHGAVTDMVKDPNFVKAHDTSAAPLAMLALAKTVVERIINCRQVNTDNYFSGLTLTVPPTRNFMDPHYHSIVGQKLLYVDWKTMHGIDISCLRCGRADLKNDRTNFSKNKILFPIFEIDGPPLWCMVQSMVCPRCKWRVNANSSEILCRLPAYARNSYPVETKCAFDAKNSHIGRSATAVMDLLMPTYGNGDLCSRLLYNAINRAYIERVEDYLSSYNKRSQNREGETTPHVEKDGAHIKNYPPVGDGIRDAYDLAAANKNTPWGISDHDRHTREIQSVGCSSIFAQDHTFEPTKNYFERKRMGAVAVWDVATETGEIASAVLVPSTRSDHFAHAAASLARRPHFTPTAMHSDTWPSKNQFWDLLFKSLEGRLGLFHYIQRITRTLKKRHTDHYLAISRLKKCIYQHQPDDYNNLLRALKEGTLSVKHTEDEIADLQATPVFRRRHDRYLRKEIRPSHIICSMLDDWFDNFKCTTSDSSSSRPARGRFDPVTGETLFSPETKEAVKQCKAKAMYLQDPLPLKDMCDTIEPSPYSPHQLKEYLSRRGESCLESFHDNLSHFANCGMRGSLADNLHLTGTARYNLTMRHKRRLTSSCLTPLSLQNPQRKKIPAAFEGTASFFNHSELSHINQMAIDAGMSPNNLPFDAVETLPVDNGERFFSEYLSWHRSTKPKNDLQGQCLCNMCTTTTTETSSNEQDPKINNNANTGASFDVTAAGVANPVAPAAQEVNQNTPARTVVPQMQVARQQVLQRPNDPPPQQQHCQYPMQPQHASTQQTHQHYQPVMMMGYYNHQYAAQLPWIMPPTYTMPQQHARPSPFCCGRYRHWFNTPNRRGRPPHEDHCHRHGANHSGNNEKNGCDKPTGHVI